MKKVLIIKMTAIGDVVAALPHIERISVHHGKDAVWVLTSPATADLFAFHPVVKTAVLNGKKWIGATGKWSGILWVRRQKFDCVYDLQGNRFSRRLVKHSKAAIRVGTQPMEIYTHHPPKIYNKDSMQNVFERLNETIESAGLKPALSAGPVYTSDRQKERVERFKSEKGLKDGAYAVFHAGSSRGWTSKRWPEAHYATLARACEKNGIRVAWIGGREDEKISRVLSRSAGVNAADAFSLAELYLFGRDALFALVNDSAPMHLLAAAGVPVFAFFGPTDWRRSHAVGQQKRVIAADVDCGPCFSGKCPKSKHVCMECISPESVFERINHAIDLGC